MRSRFRRRISGFSAMLAFAAAVLMVAGSAAQAADSNKRFAIKGIGRATCGSFVEASKKNKAEFAAFRGWLDGYLTAYNLFEKDTYDVVSWQDRGLLFGILVGHCTKNTKQRFFTAAAILANTLKRDRVRFHSPHILAESGSGKVRVYQETVRRVQKTLARLGFYAGKIDGRFGPNTRLGIEAYQQKEKLKVTGLPDRATVVKLFAPSAPSTRPSKK